MASAKGLGLKQKLRQIMALIWANEKAGDEGLGYEAKKIGMELEAKRAMFKGGLNGKATWEMSKDEAEQDERLMRTKINLGDGVVVGVDTYKPWTSDDDWYTDIRVDVEMFINGTHYSLWRVFSGHYLSEFESNARVLDYAKELGKALKKAAKAEFAELAEQRREALTIDGDDTLVKDIAEGVTIKGVEIRQALAYDEYLHAHDSKERAENEDLLKGDMAHIWSHEAGAEKDDTWAYGTRLGRVNQQIASFKALKRIAAAEGVKLPPATMAHGRKLTALKRKIEADEMARQLQIEADRQAEADAAWNNARDFMAETRLEQSSPLEFTKPAYADTELGRRIKAVRDGYVGHAHLDQIQAIGEIAYDSYMALDTDKEEEAKLENLNSRQKELDEWLTAKGKELKRPSARRDPNFANNASEYNARVREHNSLIDRKKKLKVARTDRVAKQVAEFIASVRVLCDKSDAELRTSVTDNPSYAGKRIRNAYRLFPKELAEALIARGKMTVTGTTGRGYFTQTTDGDVTFCSNDLDCAIHESMHRLERARPEIVSLEREFYAKRTYGEPLLPMSKLTGERGYRSDEVGKKDKFLIPYMGKDYEGRAYELLSVGAEMLYCTPEVIRKDPDFCKFILGILLTL